jgi:hypothetical protein
LVRITHPLGLLAGNGIGVKYHLPEEAHFSYVTLRQGLPKEVSAIRVRHLRALHRQQD